jgi:hypothetical protein
MKYIITYNQQKLYINNKSEFLSEIRDFSIRILKGKISDHKRNVCIICLSHLDNSNKNISKYSCNCKYFYHNECLFNKNNTNNKHCPICKSDYSHIIKNIFETEFNPEYINILRKLKKFHEFKNVYNQYYILIVNQLIKFNQYNKHTTPNLSNLKNINSSDVLINPFMKHKISKRLKYKKLGTRQNTNHVIVKNISRKKTRLVFSKERMLSNFNQITCGVPILILEHFNCPEIIITGNCLLNCLNKQSQYLIAVDLSICHESEEKSIDLKYQIIQFLRNTYGESNVFIGYNDYCMFLFVKNLGVVIKLHNTSHNNLLILIKNTISNLNMLCMYRKEGEYYFYSLPEFYEYKNKHQIIMCSNFINSSSIELYLILEQLGYNIKMYDTLTTLFENLTAKGLNEYINDIKSKYIISNIHSFEQFIGIYSPNMIISKSIVNPIDNILSLDMQLEIVENNGDKYRVISLVSDDINIGELFKLPMKVQGFNLRENSKPEKNNPSIWNLFLNVGIEFVYRVIDVCNYLIYMDGKLFEYKITTNDLIVNYNLNNNIVNLLIRIPANSDVEKYKSNILDYIQPIFLFNECKKICSMILTVKE